MPKTENKEVAINIDKLTKINKKNVKITRKAPNPGKHFPSFEKLYDCWKDWGLDPADEQIECTASPVVRDLRAEMNKKQAISKYETDKTMRETENMNRLREGKDVLPDVNQPTWVGKSTTSGPLVSIEEGEVLVDDPAIVGTVYQYLPEEEATKLYTELGNLSKRIRKVTNDFLDKMSSKLSSVASNAPLKAIVRQEMWKTKDPRKNQKKYEIKGTDCGRVYCDVTEEDLQRYMTPFETRANSSITQDTSITWGAWTKYLRNSIPQSLLVVDKPEFHIEDGVKYWDLSIYLTFVGNVEAIVPA
jgi:hypothetical protein